MRAVKTESVGGGGFFMRQLYKPLGCLSFPEVKGLAWEREGGEKV